MDRDWKSALKADPTDWLLERENPSVRYFTLRDILDYRDKDPEVEEARSAIGSYEKVSRIFKKEHTEGYWESPEQPYLPKYKSTYWQVMILSQLGLDKRDERVGRACDFISRFQLKEGGFTAYSAEAAAQEYRRKNEWALKKGREPPPFETFVRDTVRESELSCLTGNVAAALIRLGYCDERVKRALKWLVEVQNRDGGWLCPYWKAHVRDKHGCFMGTIPPLDAFSELPKDERTPEMEKAVEKGAEFLLMHRLFKADHHGFKVINESWLKFGFPCFSYDILRGLDVMTRLGYVEDERIDDALEIVLGKQEPDGRWMLESTPSGRMQVDLEKKGEPSKWVTLRALQVMKRVHRSRRP
jgi:prenyltransferase beta subunit